MGNLDAPLGHDHGHGVKADIKTSLCLDIAVVVKELSPQPRERI